MGIYYILSGVINLINIGRVIFLKGDEKKNSKRFMYSGFKIKMTSPHLRPQRAVLRDRIVFNNSALNSKDLKSLCQDGVIKKQ